MTDIYEVLYKQLLDYVEPGDLIQFPYLDEDLTAYTEQLRVKTITYNGDSHFDVLGFSEYYNDEMTYTIDEDFEVEVLGG